MNPTCPICGMEEKRAGPLGQTKANRLARHIAQSHEMEITHRLRTNPTDRAILALRADGIFADLAAILGW